MTRSSASRLGRLRIAAYGLGGAALLAPLGTSFAQATDRVTIDARRCIEIEARDERLACFEAEVAEASGRTEAAAAPRPEPPTRTIEVPRERARGRASDEPTEWVGSIASLTEREPNRFLITLTTGEMWLQKSAVRQPLRVGQRVRIYTSRWSSSQRLEVDGVNGFVQVERVR